MTITDKYFRTLASTLHYSWLSVNVIFKSLLIPLQNSIHIQNCIGKYILIEGMPFWNYYFIITGCSLLSALCGSKKKWLLIYNIRSTKWKWMKWRDKKLKQLNNLNSTECREGTKQMAQHYYLMLIRKYLKYTSTIIHFVPK